MREPENFMKLSTVKAKKAMMDWLGMHYEENVYYGKNHCPVQVLRNCVHPLIGYRIFRCAFREKQKTLLASVSLPSKNADSDGAEIG